MLTSRVELMTRMPCRARHRPAARQNHADEDEERAWSARIVARIGRLHPSYDSRFALRLVTRKRVRRLERAFRLAFGDLKTYIAVKDAMERELQSGL